MRCVVFVELELCCGPVQLGKGPWLSRRLNRKQAARQSPQLLLVVEQRVERLQECCACRPKGLGTRH